MFAVVYLRRNAGRNCPDGCGNPALRARTLEDLARQLID